MFNALHFFLLQNITLVTVCAGVFLLGIISGLLGTFVLLRGQCLFPDAIAHASLPGIATAYLLFASNNPFILLAGGMVFGAIGVCLVLLVSAKTVLKKDAILGIILSVFFGLGLVLLSIVQRRLPGNKALMQTYLFGNASALLPSDLITLFCVTFFVFLMLFICWKEFKLFSFDASFAKTVGFSVFLYESLFCLLLLAVVAVGLQTVGVVLMSSMLIAPAAAARQWSSNFNVIALLASLFGGLASIVGVLVSDSIDHMPTGPIIVVTLSLIVVISLCFAPHRGVLFKKVCAS